MKSVLLMISSAWGMSSTGGCPRDKVLPSRNVVPRVVSEVYRVHSLCTEELLEAFRCFLIGKIEPQERRGITVGIKEFPEPDCAYVAQCVLQNGLVSCASPTAP